LIPLSNIYPISNRVHLRYSVRFTIRYYLEVAKGEKKYDKVTTSLITAKARVTPTRSESVSRLELAACVIATRIGNALTKLMRVKLIIGLIA
jgi:hypothetical protein